MKLENILSGLQDLKVRGTLEIEISKVENDSRKIKENDLFVAIKGFDANGHEHIEEAIENGAKAVLLQIDETTKEMVQKIPSDVTIV